MQKIALVAAVAAGLAMAGTLGQAQEKKTDVSREQTASISGCVQKEADVFKRPPAIGTVGMADEFVLTHADLSTSASSTERTPESEPPQQATGTSGHSANGKVYRATGDKERELAQYVGQRLEVTGHFKNSADAARELGSVGTSGRPPETSAGTTAGDTPEFVIESIKVLSSTCDAAKK